jgi:hypothetical protein
VVLPEERGPSGGHPFLEQRRAPDREALQERRHREAGCPGRLALDGIPELEHVARERIGQFDHVPVGVECRPQRLTELLERLAEGGPGLGFRGVSPEQPGQRLAGMGPRLEDREREQPHRFGAQRGRGRCSLGGHEGGDSEEAKGEGGQRRSLGRTG